MRPVTSRWSACGGRLDRALDAVEHELVAVDPDRRAAPSPRRSCGRRLAEAPRGDRRAGEQPGEHGRRARRRRPAQRAAATTLVGTSGPGAAWRPNSWATRVRSTRPSPEMEPPPCSSATSSEVQPSSAPLAPVVGVEAGRIVAQAAELGAGTCREEPRGRLPEELLVRAQVEQHTSTLPRSWTRPKSRERAAETRLDTPHGDRSIGTGGLLPGPPAGPARRVGLRARCPRLRADLQDVGRVQPGVRRAGLRVRGDVLQGRRDVGVGHRPRGACSSVVVLAPAIGLLLERLIFRHLRTASGAAEAGGHHRAVGRHPEPLRPDRRLRGDRRRHPRGRRARRRERLLRPVRRLRVQPQRARRHGRRRRGHARPSARCSASPPSACGCGRWSRAPG